eukprot:gb/GEZN01027331.1/.p1 GENE.gb/GEZN01027331.1/~~gb/GEZN01027331.1/.p1  ORF type:complete len:105 (+),score=15.60 gb/GEZN01027331.1/:55-369(+)
MQVEFIKDINSFDVRDEQVIDAYGHLTVQEFLEAHLELQLRQIDKFLEQDLKKLNHRVEELKKRARAQVDSSKTNKKRKLDEATISNEKETKRGQSKSHLKKLR